MASTGTLYTETTQFTRGGAMRAHLSGTLFRTPIDGTKMSCHCCCCFQRIHFMQMISCTLHTDVEIFLEQQLTRHAMIVHVWHFLETRFTSESTSSIRIDRLLRAWNRDINNRIIHTQAFRMPELISCLLSQDIQNLTLL